jgi:hypothetical protein
MLTHVPSAKEIFLFREMLGLYHYQPAKDPIKVVTEAIKKASPEKAVQIATLASMIVKSQASPSTGVIVKVLHKSGAGNALSWFFATTVNGLAVLGLIAILFFAFRLYYMLDGLWDRIEIQEMLSDHPADAHDCDDNEGEKAEPTVYDNVWITKTGKKAHMYPDCSTFLSRPTKMDICSVCKNRAKKDV